MTNTCERVGGRGGDRHGMMQLQAEGAKDMSIKALTAANPALLL